MTHQYLNSAQWVDAATKRWILFLMAEIAALGLVLLAVKLTPHEPEREWMLAPAPRGVTKAGGSTSLVLLPKPQQNWETTSTHAIVEDVMLLAPLVALPAVSLPFVLFQIFCGCRRRLPPVGLLPPAAMLGAFVGLFLQAGAYGANLSWNRFVFPNMHYYHLSLFLLACFTLAVLFAIPLVVPPRRSTLP